MSAAFLLLGIGLGGMTAFLALLSGAAPLGLALAYMGGGISGIMLGGTLVFQARHSVARTTPRG